MNIVYAHLTDQRLGRFAYLYRVPVHEALGIVTSFWLHSQENLDVEMPLAKIYHYLPVELSADYHRVVCALCEAGYIKEVESDKYHIVDNVKEVRIREHRQKAGIKARMMCKKKREDIMAAKLPKPLIKTPRVKKPQDPQEHSHKLANAFAWSAYAEAYTHRYNVMPTRNARINSQISQFVKRVGQDDAGFVAKFYLSLNNKDYVRSWHSWGLALRDSETLRSQWKTNSTNSEVDQKMRARQSDYLEAQRNIDLEFMDFV